MKKKVLFIINEMINGGGQRSLLNLLELIDYDKFEVDLLLFKEQGEFMKLIPEKVNLVTSERKIQYLFMNDIKALCNIRLFRINLVHIIGTLISKLVSKSGYNKGQVRWKNFYKKVVPDMKKKYDIAISYLEGESLYYLVDKITAERKISFIHTDYSKINANVKFDAQYFFYVDSIIGISEKCVEILKETFPQYTDKISFLPNLISSKSIRREAKKYIPEEYTEISGIIILSIGRLTPLKGFDMAIKAAQKLKEQSIQFKWFILGDGEQKDELEKLIIELDLIDYVELIGVRKNPYPYIYKASIIVQTSRYEGKSMVLDEAKVLRKPIVVTNYETVKDQISESEGIVVDMNSESISVGILRMIDEHEKYEKYLEKHNYSNEEIINEYYKIMEG